ncbi:response regulator [Catenovulum sp. SM1970]|uniref:response regulator n=1 Tax=Marinifaba aquimaris TaxID=2741323 RepID=UPI001571DDD4|nr:response regulator [Marinifaba aquimaris]NTS78609.1 response regulator [Marinifaba aquimaris]
MKQNKIWIEGLLFACLAWVGVLLIDTLHLQSKIEEQLDKSTQFDLAITQWLFETLTIGFDNTYHYDKHAQLQLKVESLANGLVLNQDVSNQLAELKQDIAVYMQLTTMLKTSRRFVANSQSITITDDALLQQIYGNLNTKLMAFLVLAEEERALDIKAELAHNQVVFQRLNQHQSQWSMLSKHIYFLLENQQKVHQLLEQIQQNSITQILASHISKLHQQDLTLASQRDAYIILCLVLAFSILVMVMLRQALQLQIKTKQAQAASEVKAQFLANMSHEIRTPMNGIIGLTDLCLTTSLTSIQKEYLEKVKFSAKSLMTIINDILDFSKIESKKLDIEHVDFQLNDLLSNIKVMLGQSAAEKNLELVFDIDSKIPSTLHGDPVRIGQILLNLTSNAIKFTEQGQVTLSIELLSERSVLLFKVADTGIGLTPIQQKKLFSRFSQAESSTTRKYGGTGLGLAICKLLVELMKGKIWLSSKKSKGSTFSFELPFMPAKAENKRELDYSQLVGKRILILDDHELTLDISIKMATSLGMEVTAYQSVKQVLAVIDETEFDYALIDWQLRDSQMGSDVLQEFALSKHPPKQTFIYTAYDSEHLRDKLKAFPEVKVLHKPLTLFDLAIALMQDIEEDFKHAKIPKVKISGKEKDKTYSVLLVEDNDINRMIAVELLNQLALEVETAGNGLEALDKVEQQRFDLVLMDIQMPEMDGMEATKHLRKKYDGKALPIVALTANVMKEDITQYKALGMNDFLAKPFDRQHIEEVIERYC